MSTLYTYIISPHLVENSLGGEQEDRLPLNATVCGFNAFPFS